jgi:glyoxylase-like metal-dependent hydrolase (beta-lactamase superfamily II)
MIPPKVISIPILPLKMLKSFIIKGEKSIIVDTGFPGNEQKILDALDENGIVHGDVSLMVITHTHPDHMGSVAALKRLLPNTPVAMHRKEIIYAHTHKRYPIIPAHFVGKIFSFVPMTKVDIEPFFPDIIIDESLELKKYGINGRAIHTPGHTKGSLSILLHDSREALIGDLIAGGILIGGICCHSKPLTPPFQDSQRQVVKDLQKVLPFADKFYVAHGGPLFENDLKQKFFLNRRYNQ